ncbi:MAG: response regulator, partial [Bacteroidetes bacterium]|nr:response regulator [Bacteroidota bacterium]
MDDDTNILLAFQDFLNGEGCVMAAAPAPEEALRRMREEEFDLLITDLRLNLESGVTFVINAKRLQPKTPIIVITGYPDTVSESELKSYGASYLLLKPLELRELQHSGL